MPFKQSDSLTHQPHTHTHTHTPTDLFYFFRFGGVWENPRRGSTVTSILHVLFSLHTHRKLSLFQ
jgi:uncharacterized protein with von Willebrand factor type A (vWA) domain